MIDVLLDFTEIFGLFLAFVSQFLQQTMSKDFLTRWQRALRTAFMNSMIYTIVWSIFTHDRIGCFAVIVGCWLALPLTYLLEKP